MPTVRKNGAVCCSGNPQDFCDDCKATYARNQRRSLGAPMPTCNWDAVYEQQSLDPNGRLEYQATRNRYAEGSLSTATGGGQYETGHNPGRPEPQYHEPPKFRKSDGRAKIVDLLDEIDDDDPDLAAIRAIVQRRIAGDTTPSSVYGGPGQRSYNSAADLLALNYAPSSIEYLQDVSPRGVQLTEAQRRDPMPTVNWQQAYEEDSEKRDHERPRV
jgi:hypothetical protein